MKALPSSLLAVVFSGLVLPAAAQTPQPEKTTGALALSAETEKAKQEHIATQDPFLMDTPPPAPRAEAKPPSPVAGYVWVPGHWVPVKGEWQWIAGVWSVPATPSSLWIPSKYDAKTKKWSAGYWQPDRVQPINPPASEKSAPGAPAPAPRAY